jgi:inner membrane protein
MVVRKNRYNPSRKKWNYAGIFISTGYLVFTLINQFYMSKVFLRETERQNIKTLRSITSPTPLNNILWSHIAESDSGYYFGFSSWFDKTSEINFTYIPKNDYLLKAIEDEPYIKKLKKFSKGYYVLKKENEELYFSDVRFGLMGGWEKGEGDFVFSYKILKNEHGLKEIKRNSWSNNRFNGVSSLWKRIKGI